MPCRDIAVKIPRERSAKERIRYVHSYYYRFRERYVAD